MAIDKAKRSAALCAFPYVQKESIAMRRENMSKHSAFIDKKVYQLPRGSRGHVGSFLFMCTPAHWALSHVGAAIVSATCKPLRSLLKTSQTIRLVMRTAHGATQKLRLRTPHRTAHSRNQHSRRVNPVVEDIGAGLAVQMTSLPSPRHGA